MKKKQMIYVLGLAVAIVWGLIIYRIFGAVGGDDDTPVTAGAIQKEPYNDFAIKKDTTHLLLNYNDPFGLTKGKDTITVLTKVQHHKNTAVISAVPAVNWGFIKYSGYVKNPASRKMLTLLNINGHSVTLFEGESAESVKLLKNLRDSVKISFNGKIKFIALTPRTI